MAPDLSQKRYKDAILFSAKPKMVKVEDAIRHLSNHEELYWEVNFPISRKQLEKFRYPILGYIHICRKQVEYVATIKNIIPFSPSHFNQKFKPVQWLTEENKNSPWKHALVVTRIDPFPYDTYRLEMRTGGTVCHPPQKYFNVRPPTAVIQYVSIKDERA
ncbi:MAG: hypothetical protein ABSB91_00180 [Sedimentisphaerales bacterium]